MINILKNFGLDIALYITGGIAIFIIDGSPKEIIKNFKSLWAECKHDCPYETPEEWHAMLKQRKIEKAKKEEEEFLASHLMIFLKVSCERDNMENSCIELKAMQNKEQSINELIKLKTIQKQQQSTNKYKEQF
jgi:hypothetical protein